MKREALRSLSGGPQAKHRYARRSDPEEGRAAIRQVECRFEADDVPVEGDRAVEIPHREVRFEQAARRWLLGHAPTPASGSTEARVR
jgi:hypothetical protein